jgi:hypothetical protein
MRRRYQKSSSNEIAIVVKPYLGLQALAEKMPVWALDLPHYRNIAERISKVPASLTLFKPGVSLTPEQEFLGILATVDLHHGDYNSEGPWCVLNVYGTTVTEQISASLKEYGVTTITPTVNGFRASRVATKPLTEP